jgi:hypothetical protein
MTTRNFHMKKLSFRIGLALMLALALPMAAWAATISGQVSFGASFQQTVAGLVTYQIPLTISSGTSYGNGTSSGNVNLAYAAQLTLAGSPTTLNLQSITDPSGASITFARVREFVIQNTATTAGYDVKVEAGSSNGWSVLPPSTSPIMCRYGASLKISDPNSTGSGNGNVVTSSSENVTLDPGSNTVIVNVLIVGGSAA